MLHPILRRALVALGLIAAALALASYIESRDTADASPTCTTNWVGPANGAYTTAANWDNGVPGSTS